MAGASIIKKITVIKVQLGPLERPASTLFQNVSANELAAYAKNPANHGLSVLKTGGYVRPLNTAERSVLC